ncbi:MAG TPA: LysR family transcriptional regulator [Acidimicrobiales bacterium]|nr:LysR family transcriptional regulator [Acidimicrobiales bacterium]
MDLRQLAALTAVADHGSFSAAARALHTVQSNVSTHVARLERELGATLVDRAPGRLTAEGEIVVARARRIQGELDALTADVASVGEVVAGNARLGVIGTVGRWLVPRLVDAMRRQHPLVGLVVIDATTTSLVPQLVAGHIDLAVVNLPLDEPDVDVLPLFGEDRILVAPLDHPLAARDRVQFAELAEHELLLAAPGTAFRGELDETARAAGIELRAQAEVDGMRLLASLAFQGFGAAIIPAGAAPSYVGGDWKRIPIDGLDQRTVGLVGRRRGLLSIPARAVREQILAVVDEQLGQRTGIHPLG